MSEGPSFRPAKPWGWVIWAVQTFLRFDLAWRNRLHLEPRDLDVLRALPPGTGIILAANHADETDFKACLELSRRSGPRQEGRSAPEPRRQEEAACHDAPQRSDEFRQGHLPDAGDLKGDALSVSGRAATPMIARGLEAP